MKVTHRSHVPHVDDARMALMAASLSLDCGVVPDAVEMLIAARDEIRCVTDRGAMRVLCEYWLAQVVQFADLRNRRNS